MINPENQTKPLNRDVQDCRELVDLIFTNPTIGEQTDVIYAPLNFGLDYSRHYLRFAAGYEEGVGRGSLEVIDTTPGDNKPEEHIIMSCTVSDQGDHAFAIDRDAFGMSLPVVWPKIFGAPQISDCLYNFKNPTDEREIDPDQLLDELLVSHIRQGARPHVRTKKVEGIELDDTYIVDLSYHRHEMPVELAGVIPTKVVAGEALKMHVRFRGKEVIKTNMIFSIGGKLVGAVAEEGENFAQHVGNVASFKRAVFGDVTTPNQV